MKILVCDDQKDRCDSLVEVISQAVAVEDTIVPLPSTELSKALKILFENIETFMKDGSHNELGEGGQFDDADLIIVDNNLTHLNVSGTRLTAESIAGYIRAFSAGTYIISINKNPDVDFDLRFLIGDYDTRTDLALNERHLENRALWTGKPSDADDGFLPWYWPRLKRVVERRKDQIEFVREHLDDAVLSSLGFDEEAIGVLSYHAKGALSSDAKDGDEGSIDGVTFADVFLEVDSLPIWGERDSLRNLHKTEENSFVQSLIARVVTAHIDRWFRRDVLGPQETLVDLPHLLMRLPFLLGEKANDSAEWNNVVLEDKPPYGIDSTLYNSHLAATEFTHKMWSSGPCFWWPKLKSDDALSNHFQTADTDLWADMVFCEDWSIFFPRGGENDSQTPVAFSAEFEGSWRSRYVLPIGSKRYSPRTRLMHNR